MFVSHCWVEHEWEKLTTVAAGRTTRRAGRLGAATRGLTALLASLVGVNLTLSELTGADTLVGGTVLLETAVLCIQISKVFLLPKKAERICIPVGL